MTSKSVPASAARDADTDLGAVLLVGGKSARMGRDKALIEIQGAALISRLVATLGEVAGAGVVVVAAPEQALPALPSFVEVVRDGVAWQGPLRALAQGLRASAPAATRVFACATDLPALQPSVARRVAALLEHHDAAIPEIGGFPQLLAAAYARRAGAVAEALIDEGERSLRSLAARLDARSVTAPELLADPDVREGDPELTSFLDVDTPEELAAALARLH